MFPELLFEKLERDSFNKLVSENPQFVRRLTFDKAIYF